MTHKKPETLAQYVDRLMREKKLSGYEIERRTGKQISQSYVNRIKKGQVLNPSPDKLQILAKGLEVTEEELFSVVRGKSPESLALVSEQLENLLFKFERIGKSDRPYAQALIDLLTRELERLDKKAKQQTS